MAGGERYWLNGAFTDARGATIPLLDRGLLFGDSLYEVVRFYKKRCFLLAEHLDRLFGEAKAIDFPVRFGAVEIGAAIEGLVARGDEEDGLVLLHWTRGEGARRLVPPPGLRGNVFAVRLPLPPLPRGALRRGVPVVILPDRRWLDAQLKSTNLLGSVIARTKAAAAGAHEAVLYRGRGGSARLTEGTSSSLFVVRRGRLATPAVRGLLPGITRGIVLDVAGGAGIPVEERTVRPAELRTAREAFLTSTSAEVLPIAKVDGAPLPGDAPGPMTRRIAAAFRRFRARVLRKTGRAAV